MVQVVAVIGSLIMLAAMLLMVSEVIIRTPLISRSMLFSYDLFRLLMSGFIICAMTYCTFHEGHVSITIVLDRFPEIVRRLLAVIRILLLMGIWVAVAWYCMDYAVSMWTLQEKTLVAKVPVYPFRVFFAAGAIILCLATLPQLFTRVKKVFEK